MDREKSILSCLGPSQTLVSWKIIESKDYEDSSKHLVKLVYVTKNCDSITWLAESIKTLDQQELLPNVLESVSKYRENVPESFLNGVMDNLREMYPIIPSNCINMSRIRHVIDLEQCLPADRPLVVTAYNVLLETKGDVPCRVLHYSG